MRKTAAILAIVFAAAMIFATAVFADGPGSCTIVQTSYASQGGQFTVEVRLSNNPGIRNMSCNIRFDYQSLELVSVSDSGLLGGFYYTSPSSSNISLTWTGNGKDVEDNGLLATITFKAIDAPEEGTIVYNTVSAHSGNGITVQVDGMTTVLFFGDNRNANTPQNPQNPEQNDPATTQPNGNNGEDETENLDDDEDETEQIPEETTAPTTQAPETTTTPPTTTTSPTTTTRKTTTEATTVTTTEATTTEPTTTPEPETTPEETTEPTTTPEPETEPTTYEEEVTTTTEAEPTFADVYETPVDNKSANRGTILIALMAIALTVVVVIAIEMYKRGR